MNQLESEKGVSESAGRAGMRLLLVASIGDVFECSTKLAMVIDVFGEFCKRRLLEIKRRSDTSWYHCICRAVYPANSSGLLTNSFSLKRLRSGLKVEIGIGVVDWDVRIMWYR